MNICTQSGCCLSWVHMLIRAVVNLQGPAHPLESEPEPNQLTPNPPGGTFHEIYEVVGGPSRCNRIETGYLYPRNRRKGALIPAAVQYGIAHVDT